MKEFKRKKSLYVSTLLGERVNYWELSVTLLIMKIDLMNNKCIYFCSQ